MNKSPDDDELLLEFLRQHAGNAPPAAPELEEKIVRATISSARPQRQRQLWILPPAIAATIAIAWTGYHLFMHPNYSSAEMKSLEAFLESSWGGSVLGPNIQTE
jgi:hypothetical protein